MRDENHPPAWSGELVCPVPITNHQTVQLAHGSGGRLSAELITKFFRPRFSNPYLDRLEDQAVLPRSKGRLAFSTDTFVVDPLFFPGGSIGDLAVNGTVNDVCMSGAKPLYLSAGFVLEEGLPLVTLHRILLDMERAARQAGVVVVTGDTKVVPRGSCDKIFINTSGLGEIPDGVAWSAARLEIGDQIIISGSVADHGMAVMTCRQGLSFQSGISSDTASLASLVADMMSASGAIRAMRDPTRGGLAATLNEFAGASGQGLEVDRQAIPVRTEVAAACEILGIDPLNVANEGKLLVVVAADAAEGLLGIMRQHPLGHEAMVIGTVVGAHPGLVAVKNALGILQILEMPLGEQLPRIC